MTELVARPNSNWLICLAGFALLIGSVWTNLWIFGYRSTRVVESVSIRGTGKYDLHQVSYFTELGYRESPPQMRENKEWIVYSRDGFTLTCRTDPHRYINDRVTGFWK